MNSKTALVLTVFFATFGVGWIAGSSAYRVFNQREEAGVTNLDFNSLADRIIRAESNGNAKEKNKLSSASGPAQFLEETWLEMITAHRRDLVNGRSRAALLKLRDDPNMARELMMRLLEKNAKVFYDRHVPITPGSLYLAHFAGTAGALALLSCAESESAASVMASADATGRMTREKIVWANPFLVNYTVADLRRWADQKMQRSGSFDASPVGQLTHTARKVAFEIDIQRPGDVHSRRAQVIR
jgi:hypothetical protein